MGDQRPPLVCDMCGSQNIRVQNNSDSWMLKCLDCGHWDQQWKDEETEEDEESE